MSVVLKKTIPFLFIILLSINSFASQKSIENTKKEIALWHKEEENIRVVMRKIEEEMFALSQKISELKVKEQESRSIFGSIKLDNLLRESEKIEKKLREEEKKLGIISRRIREKNETLMRQYTEFLEESKKDLGEMKNKKSEEFARIFEEYARAVEEREKLASSPLIKVIDFSSVTIGELDTREEIKEKIDILKDYREKMIEHKRAITDRLHELGDRKKLLDQVRQFDEELAFFSDDFVKFAAKVKESSTATEDDEEPDESKGGSPTPGETTGGATESGGTENSETNASETNTPEETNGTESQALTNETNQDATGTETAGVETNPTTNETTPTSSNTQQVDTNSTSTLPENIATRGENVAPFKNNLDVSKEISPLRGSSVDALIQKLKANNLILDDKLKEINQKIRNFKDIAKARGEANE